MGRNALCRQHPGIHLAPSGQAAEQNHDIPVPHRTERSRVPIPDLFSLHQLPDAVRRGVGFQLSSCELRLLFFSAFFRHIRIQQNQLRRVHLQAVPESSRSLQRDGGRFCCAFSLSGFFLRLGYLCSQIQGRGAVVADSAHGLRHQPGKDAVGPVQHLSPAPEIFVKIDPDFRSPVCLGIAVVFLHEKLRPGQAETVDALLHIAYHKDIGHALSPGHAV